MKIYRIELFSLLMLTCALAFAADPTAKPSLTDPGQPALSPVVRTGEGGSQSTAQSVRALRPEDPRQLSGRYRLIGITDGHGWLDVRMHKSTDGKEAWKVDINVVTEWSKDDWNVVSIENAEFHATATLSFFESDRPNFAGFFVQFTEFIGDTAERRAPEVPAIILGRDVFVRDDSYKPRSYRTPAPAE